MRTLVGVMVLAFLGAWYPYRASAIPFDPPGLTKLTKEDLKEAKQQLQAVRQEFKAARQDFRVLKQDFKAGEISRNQFRAAKENFQAERQNFRATAQQFQGLQSQFRVANAIAAPIPGTLLLFGAGFAGLVTWQRYMRRHSQ